MQATQYVSRRFYKPHCPIDWVSAHIIVPSLASGLSTWPRNEQKGLDTPWEQ